MFKTPQFWLKSNWLSIALIPLTFVYKLGFYFKKKFSTPNVAKIPVLCVGNIIAGGSGKTPVAIALGSYLKNKGVNFCYLTRGYKSQNKGVKYLDNSHNYSAQEVGDEAILLNEMAPVFVAKNRWHGYQEIAKNSQFRAIIMDDGLQNFQLHHHVKILVIDAKIAFGNNHILPSGPMRQSLESIIDQIDLFIIIGQNNSDISKKILTQKSSAQIAFAKIVVKNLAKFIDQNVIAFCGIAYPQKFFDLIIDSGIRIIETHSFDDHHKYQNHEIENLINIAQKQNCKLITTKKDWVKFPQSFQKNIDFLDINLEFDDENVLNNALEPTLKQIISKN